MTIEVTIKHPYEKYDKSIKVTVFDPFNGNVHRTEVLDPGSFEKRFAVYANSALIVSEEAYIVLPKLDG